MVRNCENLLSLEEGLGTLGEGECVRAGDTDGNGKCGGVGGGAMVELIEGAGVAFGCSAGLGAGI